MCKYTYIQIFVHILVREHWQFGIYVHTYMHIFIFILVCVYVRIFVRM